ncbi:4-trimethylaminobutyraldehyde dehydrogenase-like [Amphiura filiformis]|uniref:4-trimethylaminobutyraldehyde dehydrogenase-like n=1 Tax=Amphiura filiformis TaxID=82378 RepID=UPI003B20CCFC
MLSRLGPVVKASGMSRCMSTFFQEPLNFIGGKRVLPTNRNSSEDFKVLDPSTGHVLCETSSSGENDVDKAVASAKEAFKEWSETPALVRARLLQKAALVLRENVEDFAMMEVMDNGKPIWEARLDIWTAVDALDYFGSLAPTLAGEHIKMPSGSFGYTIREPLGVCGGIGAWNYPIQMAAWKSAPALACGNTMVFKPSPLTPVTAVMLAELYTECGLPKGVFNVIQGQAETGHLLCTHPDIAKVSFTGSVPTGTKIMQDCAVGIKPVTLELGGKSPLIIFGDSDVDNAVKGAMLANFLSQGQVCSNGTRVFVEKKIKDEFVEKLVARTEAMKLGDPSEDDTLVGATISHQQMDKVLGYVEGAKKEGAKVLCGGDRVIPENPKLSGGFFVRPCVLDNLNDGMTVVKEEVFGSVLGLLAFEDEEEVIQRANDTKFGLAGGVFTRDLGRANRVISRLEAGSCWINTFNICPAGLPFGGFKYSGLGRENGTVTIDHYTQLKSVYVEMNDLDVPF